MLDPVCSSNVDEESNIFISIQEMHKIEIKCIVTYGGNWAPSMMWRHVGGQVITTGVVDTAEPSDNVQSTLTIAAASSMTGSRISCTTYFRASDKPASTNATNVPNHNRTWISPVIQVQCKYTLAKARARLSRTVDNHHVYWMFANTKSAFERHCDKIVSPTMSIS